MTTILALSVFLLAPAAWLLAFGLYSPAERRMPNVRALLLGIALAGVVAMFARLVVITLSPEGDTELALNAVSGGAMFIVILPFIIGAIVRMRE